MCRSTAWFSPRNSIKQIRVRTRISHFPRLSRPLGIFLQNSVKRKENVVPMLNQPPLHENILENGGMVPYILNRNSRLRIVICFTTWQV
jgi:hypothetical protein